MDDALDSVQPIRLDQDPEGDVTHRQGLDCDAAFPSVDELVDHLLQGLPERERDVLERRYGLRSGQQTIKEIAAALDRSPERVRQIYHKGLRSLRRRGGEQLKASLLQQGAIIWKALQLESSLLTLRQVERACTPLPPRFRLALAAASLPLPVWLEAFAAEHGKPHPSVHD